MQVCASFAQGHQIIYNIFTTEHWNLWLSEMLSRLQDIGQDSHKAFPHIKADASHSPCNSRSVLMQPLRQQRCLATALVAADVSYDGYFVVAADAEVLSRRPAAHPKT